MFKNFLQLTRKQKIITIVVYTVIAAITMYLGYKQSQAPVVTTKSLTGFQSAQLPSAPDNSILGWLNFHKIGLVFAPVSVLILDYFKIHLIRKGFILKTLLSAGLILLFSFLLQVALVIVFTVVVLAVALGILFNEFGSSSGSYSGGEIIRLHLVITMMLSMLNKLDLQVSKMQNVEDNKILIVTKEQHMNTKAVA